jgi:hypothetical protein
VGRGGAGRGDCGVGRDGVGWGGDGRGGAGRGGVGGHGRGRAGGWAARQADRQGVWAGGSPAGRASGEQGTHREGSFCTAARARAHLADGDFGGKRERAAEADAELLKKGKAHSVQGAELAMVLAGYGAHRREVCDVGGG